MNHKKKGKIVCFYFFNAGKGKGENNCYVKIYFMTFISTIRHAMPVKAFIVGYIKFTVNLQYVKKPQKSSSISFSILMPV